MGRRRYGRWEDGRMGAWLCAFVGLMGGERGIGRGVGPARGECGCVKGGSYDPFPFQGWCGMG